MGFLWGTPACRALFGHPQAQAQAAAPIDAMEEMSDDPEAGEKHLTTLMRQFNEAVTNKQFDVAAGLIKRAELGVDKASEVTRSHPDFDDTADTVHRGRPRLELAIENDRIERRNAAIDALIEHGTQAMHQNATWLTELANRPPVTSDVQQLDEALHTFADLKRSGENYLDEPRYRSHAEARDALATRLGQLQARATRQIQLMATITPFIDAGFAAAEKARSAESPEQQLQAFKQVAQAFSGCVDAIAARLKEPGFDAEAATDSRLGHMSLGKTQAQCAAAVEQASDKINRFGWDVLVGTLSRVLPAARGTGGAAQAATAEALQVLTQCAEATPGVLTGSTAQKAVFETPLGKLKFAALPPACSKEAARIKARGPTLVWQSHLEEARDRANGAIAALTQASAADTPAERRVELLGQAAGGLTECVERTDDLAKQPTADRKFKVTSAFGQVSAADLSRACKRAAADVQARVPQAVSAKKQADFTATCHGDEVAVVARDGVPQRIEAVGPGRVFVYTSQRIAFDARGMRTDEALLRTNKP